MSTPARIISLRVRAKRSSDHAFNIGGIIETVHPTLSCIGTTAAIFDVRGALYSSLAQQEVDGSGIPTGRLIHDSKKLRDVLLSHSAFVLANETIAADLDQAIIRRQNQYLSKYQFLGEIQQSLNLTYPVKLDKLKSLISLADSHFQALHSVYNPGGGLPSASVTSPKVVMATRVTGMGSRQDSTTKVMEGVNEKQTHSSVSSSWMTKWDPSTNGWVDVKDSDAVALSQETISVSENDELRHPNLENQIRFERVTADLLDEVLSETLFSLRVPNMERILTNELADIDLDIRRLQIQFIETFLTPRLNGIITEVQKDAGDNVRTGEPVFRIEDDSVLLLTGQFKCLDSISVGQAFIIETKNVFESIVPKAVTLSGKVVSVRGYDSESDKWNVVLECPNSTTPRLPLGYDFEPHPDFTKVTFQ